MKLVTSASEITVEESNMRADGLFIYSGVGAIEVRKQTDGCRVVIIKLLIRIKKGLPKVQEQKVGARYGYRRHNGDPFSQTGWLTPVYEETKAHEQGHAEAYWAYLRPRIEQDLDQYCCKVGDDEAIRAQVVAEYEDLIKTPEYLKKSADAADQATITFYTNDPHYKSLNAAQYSLQRVDYLWERQ